MKYTKGQSKGKEMLAFWPNSLEAVNMKLVNASDTLPACVLRYSYRPKDGWALVDVSKLTGISEYRGEIKNIPEVMAAAQKCLLHGWCVPLIKDTLFVTEDRKLMLIALPYMEQAPGSIEDLKAILSSRDEFDCFKADSDSGMHQFEANGKRVKKEAETQSGFGFDFFGRAIGGSSAANASFDFFGRPIESAPQEDIIDFFGAVSENKANSFGAATQNDDVMDAFFNGAVSDKADGGTSDDAFFGFMSNDEPASVPDIPVHQISVRENANNEEVHANALNPFDSFFGFTGSDNSVNAVPSVQAAEQDVDDPFGGFVPSGFETAPKSKESNILSQDPFMMAFMGGSSPEEPKAEKPDNFDFFGGKNLNNTQNQNNAPSFDSIFRNHDLSDLQTSAAQEGADISKENGAFDFFSGFAQEEEKIDTPFVQNVPDTNAAEAVQGNAVERTTPSFGFDFFSGTAVEPEENFVSFSQDADTVKDDPVQETDEVQSAVSNQTESPSSFFDFFGAPVNNEPIQENSETIESVSFEKTAKQDVVASEAEKQAEPDMMDFFSAWSGASEEAFTEPSAASSDEFISMEDNSDEIPLVEAQTEQANEEMNPIAADEPAMDDFFSGWSVLDDNAQASLQMPEEAKVEANDRIEEAVADDTESEKIQESPALDFFSMWTDTEETEPEAEQKQPDEYVNIETAAKENMEAAADDLDATINTEPSMTDFFGSWDSPEESAEEAEPATEEQPYEAEEAANEEQAEEVADDLDATINTEPSVADFFGSWDSPEESAEEAESESEEQTFKAEEAANDEKAETVEDLDATIDTEPSVADFFGSWDSPEESAEEAEPESEEQTFEAEEAANDEKAETAEDLDATIDTEPSVADFFGSWDSPEESAEEAESESEEQTFEAEVAANDEKAETVEDLDATINTEPSVADFFGSWDSPEETAEDEEPASEEQTFEAEEAANDEKAETVDDLDATIDTEPSVADFFEMWDAPDETAEEPAEPDMEEQEKADNDLDSTISTESSVVDIFGSWDSHEETAEDAEPASEEQPSDILVTEDVAEEQAEEASDDFDATQNAESSLADYCKIEDKADEALEAGEITLTNQASEAEEEENEAEDEEPAYDFGGMLNTEPSLEEFFGLANRAEAAETAEEDETAEAVAQDQPSEGAASEESASEEQVIETIDEMDTTISAEASMEDFFGTWDSPDDDSEEAEPAAEQQPSKVQEADEEGQDEEAAKDLDAASDSEPSVNDFFEMWDRPEDVSEEADCLSEEEQLSEVQEAADEAQIEEASDNLDAAVTDEPLMSDFFEMWSGSEEIPEKAQPAFDVELKEETQEALQEISDEPIAEEPYETAIEDFFDIWNSPQDARESGQDFETSTEENTIEPDCEPEISSAQEVSEGNGMDFWYDTDDSMDFVPTDAVTDENSFLKAADDEKGQAQKESDSHEEEAETEALSEISEKESAIENKATEDADFDRAEDEQGYDILDALGFYADPQNEAGETEEEEQENAFNWIDLGSSFEASEPEADSDKNEETSAGAFFQKIKSSIGDYLKEKTEKNGQEDQLNETWESPKVQNPNMTEDAEETNDWNDTEETEGYDLFSMFGGETEENAENSYAEYEEEGISEQNEPEEKTVSVNKPSFLKRISKLFSENAEEHEPYTSEAPKAKAAASADLNLPKQNEETLYDQLDDEGIQEEEDDDAFFDLWNFDSNDEQ